MRKGSSIIAILLIGILVGLWMRGCHRETIKMFPDEIDSLINLQRHRADSIQREVEKRDSLIVTQKARTDTVIKKTDRYVYLYRNTTDTITMLIACDSVVTGYEVLKKDYIKNDSLHILNEQGLQMAVTYLRSALDTAQYGYDALAAENDHLKKNNKRLVRVAVVSSSIAILAFGAFIIK